MILDDLQIEDRFNIIQYNTGARFWKPGEIMNADSLKIASAKDYIRNMNNTGCKFTTE